MTSPFTCRRAGGGRLCAVLASIWLTGCTTGSVFLPSASQVDEPWQIPGDAFPTQRLYRIRYDGPEGELSFRLTLYLAARESYRMDASDGLGRRVWSLAVEEGRDALWLDHREDLYCRIAGADQQSFVPIAYLPLVNLPRLILGRMPADPFDDLRRTADRISYLDRGGQQWSGQLDRDGRVLWWSLVESGEAVAWWKLREDGDEGDQIFVDGRRGQELRWTEQVREPLQRPLEALQVPPRYEPGDCGDPVGDDAPAGGSLMGPAS